MNHASLFSGIGGAELAAQWMGWNNIFHCEINPFGRKVLDYWFPNSISYEDITKTDFKEWRGKIDILTGGFPCHPFSQAGKRKGDTDDRYLWPQMLRAIQEIRPTWIVGENVAGIVSMVESGEDIQMGNSDDIFEKNIIYRKEQQFTIERICEDFEREGYSVQPIIIPACAVGAPHRRDRVWFIAHRYCNRQREWKNKQEFVKGCERTPNNSFVRKDVSVTNAKCVRGREVHNEIESEQSNGDGINSNGDERIITNTNSNGCLSSKKSFGIEEKKRIISQQSEWRFSTKRTNGLSGFQQSSSDTKSERLEGHGGKILQRENKRFTNRCKYIKQYWQTFPTQPPICCGNDGLSDRLDGITFPKWRAESIKAYGNAWVPQVAYEIFKAIESSK